MGFKKVRKIELNEVTSYLAGVIVGDGHIRNGMKSKTNQHKDYGITIEVIDVNFLQEIERVIKSIIKTKSSIKTRIDQRGNRKPLHIFSFRNKHLYFFLTNDLEIPAGKKSSVVRIPTRIIGDETLHKAFLAGLFDTDGGIRGSSVGYTSASQGLMQDVSTILTKLNVGHSSDSWTNHTYNKKFYGIRISRGHIDRFLKGMPLRAKQKLEKVSIYVDVPEWSNSL